MLRLFSFESIFSDKTFCRLRSYWDECETEHSECKDFNRKKQKLPVLPKRGLDIASIDKSSEVKLYITKENEQGRYIALSYCWGGPQRLTTTTKTLRKRVKGIDDLSRTFQDAVRITR